MNINKVKTVLKDFGFSKNSANEKKLKNNYHYLKKGNFKIFNKLNGDIGVGPLDITGGDGNWTTTGGQLNFLNF